MKWRPVLVVTDVNVGVELQQLGHDLMVGVVTGCVMEGRPLFVRHQIHVSQGLDQSFDDLLAARAVSGHVKRILDAIFRFESFNNLVNAFTSDTLVREQVTQSVGC